MVVDSQGHSIQAIIAFVIWRGLSVHRSGLSLLPMFQRSLPWAVSHFFSSEQNSAILCLTLPDSVYSHLASFSNSLTFFIHSLAGSSLINQALVAFCTVCMSTSIASPAQSINPQPTEGSKLTFESLKDNCKLP